MADINCIDVSTWQGNIDWEKVKAAGYGHAIIRAGFGREVSQIDNKFEQNYTNAKAAGVVLGVYWYSYAVDKADAIREAKACLTVLNKRKLEMPVYFDMEDTSMTKLGKKTLTEMAKAFCEEIKKGGYRAGVYSNPNWFNNYLDYNALKKLYSIWLAQYYKEAQYECDVWQYTSSGKVNGISGNVDMNIIYNSGIVESGSDSSKDTDNKEEIVRTELKVGQTGLDILCLKTLLLIAYDMGLCTSRMTHGTDYAGPGMGTAIKECCLSMGIVETEVADKDFVTKLYTAISSSYPKKGDFNGDGEVNIKDATAIQKHLAGLE